MRRAGVVLVFAFALTGCLFDSSGNIIDGTSPSTGEDTSPDTSEDGAETDAAAGPSDDDWGDPPWGSDGSGDGADSSDDGSFDDESGDGSLDGAGDGDDDVPGDGLSGDDGMVDDGAGDDGTGDDGMVDGGTGDDGTGDDGTGDDSTGDDSGDDGSGDGSGDDGAGDGMGDDDGSGDGDDGFLDVPGGAHCAAVATWDPQDVQFEEEVLLLTNEARARGHNCDSQGNFGPTGPLTMNPSLRCSARLHSVYMGVTGDFNHTQSQTGLDPFERMRDAGYDWRTAGENIAAGQRSPDDVVSGWLESDGHCSNIMSPDFEDIGIGYTLGALNWDGEPSPTPYWTQNFGAQ